MYESNYSLLSHWQIITQTGIGMEISLGEGKLISNQNLLRNVLCQAIPIQDTLHK